VILSLFFTETTPTRMVDMYTKLSASRAYVYAVARACDAGHISRRDCAGVILYSSDRAVEVTSEAMQSLGGNGYINEYPVARMLRDARLYTVGAGTQEIRRMLVGRTFNEGEAASIDTVILAPTDSFPSLRIGMIPSTSLYLLPCTISAQ
jgi:alkylation response protein AidB-like acyl-CoA dehydrogenase